MRPYLLAAALVAALAPASASSAAENTCLIRVSPTTTSGWLTEVEATMTCAASFPGMAITVCLESLKPSETVGWTTESCDTTQASAGAMGVWGMTGACVLGPALVRGAAYAVDQYGRTVAGWVSRPSEGGSRARFRGLLAAVLLAATPLPHAAAEDVCMASAEAPYGDPNVLGTGTLTCTAPFAGMRVTACLQYLPVSGDLIWLTQACSTVHAGPGATSVTATAVRCFDEAAVVRTTAAGTDQLGRETWAISAPVLVRGVGSCGP